MEKNLNPEQEEAKTENLDQPEVEEQEESSENVSRETLEGLTISFEPNFNDIFYGLNDTDTADGTNKKERRLYLALTILMLLQIVWFAYTRSGFAMILMLLLGGMAIVLRKKSQSFNHKIAQEFVEEGTQTVIFGEDKVSFNGKEIEYDEINHFYELKKCFSIIYQGNHVYVIPKVELEQEQTTEMMKKIDEMIPQAYENKTKK